MHYLTCTIYIYIDYFPNVFDLTHILAIFAAVLSSLIGLFLPNVFGEIVDRAKAGTTVNTLKIPALKAIGSHLS